MNRALYCFAVLLLLLIESCSKPVPPQAPEEPEVETLSRTEFTNRVENFFEYEALRSGKPSQLLIHLTDLADGSPVENAEVTLALRVKGSSDPVVRTTSKIGKVTGIYVAELVAPKPGEYEIEFHVKNDKLDERMPLSDFQVE